MAHQDRKHIHNDRDRAAQAQVVDLAPTKEVNGGSNNLRQYGLATHNAARLSFQHDGVSDLVEDLSHPY